MKKVLFTTLALLLISSMAFAHKLDGDWKTQIDTDNGKMNIYLTLKVEKKKVSGTIGNDQGTVSLYKGSVKGKTFEYTFDVGDYTIEHKGKILGKDEIEVTSVSGPTEESTFTLQRVKK